MKNDCPKSPAEAILRPDLVRLDKQAAFMLYATFCGDAVRTAAALKVAPAVIFQVAKEEEWDAKLAPIISLYKDTGSPAAVERALNRALNLVQAALIRQIVSALLASLKERARGGDLLDAFVEKDAIGEKRISFRTLKALADVARQAHAMTYAALGDTEADRNRRNDPVEDSISASALHARVAEAVSKVMSETSPSGVLLEEQLATARHISSVDGGQAAAALVDATLEE